jgi:hypothetical protein
MLGSLLPIFISFARPKETKQTCLPAGREKGAAKTAIPTRYRSLHTFPERPHFYSYPHPCTLALMSLRVRGRQPRL